jgi:hypothetical protein
MKVPKEKTLKEGGVTFSDTKVMFFESYWQFLTMN